ncbi:MAG: DUF4337 domain-containing protein [Hyphomicrobium sp.]|nr:DUF4337 domain-containing protein [Hyphomicrobium sp.]
MAFKDLAEAIEDTGKKHRDRMIAVYIGVLAVLLAISGVGGGNATKEATARNIEASNTWAFFQAKNIRRHQLRLQITEFEALLAGQPALPEAARAMIEENIAKYRKDEVRLGSEPDTGEGLKELLVKGKVLEEQRNRAMLEDPFFDYGQALLQIAIVLASVAIITGGTSLLVLSGVLAALGAAATLNGYLLFWVPPLGG